LPPAKSLALAATSLESPSDAASDADIHMMRMGGYDWSMLFR
jgi:hypothetical protein